MYTCAKLTTFLPLYYQPDYWKNCTQWPCLGAIFNYNELLLKTSVVTTIDASLTRTLGHFCSCLGSKQKPQECHV
jgi:hypothetical protein